MKTTALSLGLLALLGSVLPPVLFMTGSMPEATMKSVMLASCLVWFATAPVWMKAD